MMTTVPENTDRDTMNIILSQQGFSPMDVRVIHKINEGGGSRSFGFIEFASVEDAKKYMRFTDVSSNISCTNSCFV